METISSQLSIQFHISIQLEQSMLNNQQIRQRARQPADQVDKKTLPISQRCSILQKLQTKKNDIKKKHKSDKSTKSCCYKNGFWQLRPTFAGPQWQDQYFTSLKKKKIAKTVSMSR